MAVQALKYYGQWFYTLFPYGEEGAFFISTSFKDAPKLVLKTIDIR